MKSHFRISRPLYRGGLIELQRSNLRALLRQLHREHGTWIAVTNLLRVSRSVVREFMDGKNPGNIEFAQRVAMAIRIDLDVALAGQFTITEKGVKAIGGAQ